MKPQFEEKKDSLLVRAPAKINISLLISGKRDDGYHEIETIMSKITLYDELVFEWGNCEGIELICKGQIDAPCNKDNLVYKACQMVLDASGVKGTEARKKGLKVTLNKNIPVGAGLGGGSSDAAGALMGLNKFGQFGLSCEDVYKMACGLGSDVPFFLGGPLALCTGRGEKVETIHEIFPFKAVLVTPVVSVSTKEVYGSYKHKPSLYMSLHDEINACIKKKKIDFVAGMCANMLESSCFALNRELGELKSCIESFRFGRVCLSGSGSTMYCIFCGVDQQRDVENYQAMLNDSIGCNTIIVDSNRW